MNVNVSKRGIGVNLTDHGTWEIKVWSPLAHKVSVITDEQSIALKKMDYGYWSAETQGLKEGTGYMVQVDDKKPLPDPASVFQPYGVHGSSVAIDLQQFKWSDKNWRNLSLSSYIIYELHTGTFTESHNFDGIIEKLDYLVDIGVNAIEIMPVAQFPGERNWGYDGVFPFAVQDSYGGPRKLQQLVNACHEKGIAVVLDVIYNHLGPEGNYLGEFGPYFTEKYKTPWGKALNFDDAWCDGVRNYFIENALMWFRDFHIDALRLDAVHAIKDLSTTHILKEIRQRVNELSQKTGMPYYLIAEMDLNDPQFINPADKGGYGLDAQWVDEFHHALRVSSGQKREGYYADFSGIAHLSKSYNDVYVYDGQFSEHRKRFFGAKTSNPGHQFVVFSQNHDQVGNRMLGERTSQLVSFEMCKLLAGAVFVSPFIPMLFMGEEYAETNPFQFFISHTDRELAELVNKGRKQEFSSFNWQGEAPDPRLEETFINSMLQWRLIGKEKHQRMLGFYKQIIRLKKEQPALRSGDRLGTNAYHDDAGQVVIVRRKGGGQEALCILNFAGEARQLNLPPGDWNLLIDSAAPEFGYEKNEPKDEKKVSAESIRVYA